MYSPILTEVASATESTMRDYVSIAAPGVRFPHRWRCDGTPVHDSLGNGYSLLSMAGVHETGEFELAMQRIHAPTQKVRMQESRLRERYERDLTLVRPDLHLAWRANHLSQDADALACLVTGHAPGGM